ncbi:MAG: hypothetical protein AAFX06_00410 [Planctomycetota bacterium]
MDVSNPYLPPATSPQDATPLPLPGDAQLRRRALAISISTATILGGMILVYFAESSNGFSPPVGIWLIVSTGVISVLTAVFTRDVIFSPLCCLGGMMASVTLAAIMKSWSYVSLEVTVPLTLLVTVPSFVIAYLLSRRMSKRLRLQTQDAAADPMPTN